jgi:hypothetical protein
MPIQRVTVICKNKECLFYDEHRQVGLLHLGQGVYQRAGLVCVCGRGLIPEEED